MRSIACVCLLLLSLRASVEAASSEIFPSGHPLPQNRGGSGGGSVPHETSSGLDDALPEEDHHGHSVGTHHSLLHDTSVQESFDAAKDTPQSDDAAIGDVLHPLEGSFEHEQVADVVEEPKPKTHEELIAEELQRREEELKRRADEEVRRKEELKLRAEEEGRREAELQRRAEEEERRAQADILVQEELDRRAAAEALTAPADGTQPEDPRNKRHEEKETHNKTDDMRAIMFEEESKHADNLSRKEEIEIKHLEDGRAHEAAGVSLHDHEAYQHEEISRQRDEMIRKLEMERKQQEEEVKRFEEARQREEFERIQREQEYIIQQENKKRNMEDDHDDDHGQHWGVSEEASSAKVSASAYIFLFFAPILLSCATLLA